MPTQITAQIDHVRSHHVTLGYRGELQKEELYPQVDIDYRGTVRRVEVSADRYVSTAGLGEWRVYVKRIDPDQGVGPKGRSEISATVVPLVTEWLESEGYAESRQRAYAYAISREIHQMGTTADYRAREALQVSGPECRAADLDRLQRAYNARMESLELLDGGFSS